MVQVGIDVGAKFIKVLVLKDGNVVAKDQTPSGFEGKENAKNLFDQVLQKANISQDEVNSITSTGSGRKVVDFATKSVNDVTAASKGATTLLPEVHTVIDVGAEEGRSIRCNHDGKIVDFAINEKCAAGSGEFLEYIVNAMEVNIEDAGKLSLLSKTQVSINANCAVFAESEVVSLIHSNVARPDIIHAVLDSLAKRTASLGQRVDCEEDMALVGGLARIEGFIKCMEKHIGTGVLVPENPQFTAAVGAALLSAEVVTEGNE